MPDKFELARGFFLKALEEDVGPPLVGALPSALPTVGARHGVPLRRDGVGHPDPMAPHTAVPPAAEEFHKTQIAQRLQLSADFITHVAVVRGVRHWRVRICSFARWA